MNLIPDRAPLIVSTPAGIMDAKAAEVAIRASGGGAWYPSAQPPSCAPMPSLANLTVGLGFAKRADTIIRVARFISEELGGQIPDNYEALISIPFVGIYTAAAVLCLGHGQPIAMVDVNTVRILSRVLSLIPREDSPRGDPAIIAAADSVVLCLPGEASKINFGFIDVGAFYCRKNPVCEPCPLKHCCDYYKTEIALL